jgi:stage IV sporulation protein FB
MAFLGFDRRNPALLVIWMVVVFVSVLLHELGHAWTGKAFGLSPQIDLAAFGGLTSWAHKDVSNGKKILISLAGPCMGFAVGAALYFGLRFSHHGELSPLAEQAFSDALYVNIGWGVFNLLPILPLDGGNVLLHALAALTGGGGRKAAHIVSIVFAASIAAGALYLNQWYIALFVGLFALQNVRALAPERSK